MTTSRYIARLMGPVLLTIGVGMVMGMLTEGDGYSSLLKEFISSRALIFTTGVLALVAGVAIVNAHNLWVPDWRVLVTVLGWLMILRGIMNLVFPITADAWRPDDCEPCRRARRCCFHRRARGDLLHYGL